MKLWTKMHEFFAENLNVSDLLPAIPPAAGQLERQPKQQLVDLQDQLVEQLIGEEAPAEPWNIRHDGHTA